MKVYATCLPNQARCFLIDDFLPNSYLMSLHEICDQFDKNSAEWQHPTWTQCRYIYQGNAEAWQSIKKYLAIPNDELAQSLGYAVVCDETLLWAEFQGLGKLRPHVEDPAGKHLSQVYISKQPVPNIGTTIYTDNHEILFLLPFRDNFGWFFDDSGKITHGREHDIPSGMTRFTMMMHWSKI